LDQAYFALQGLRAYNYTEYADKLQSQLFTSIPSLRFGNTEPLSEYYNPHTGVGLGARNFGWTAAHALLMACNAKEPVHRVTA
jgi:putative isomerase